MSDASSPGSRSRSSSSPPDRPPLPPRAPRAVLQPRFSLGILYILLFFFVYSLLLVLPELLHVLRTVPTGPEQERAAQELVREAYPPRLWLALALAVATGALGMAKGVLPGTGRRS